MALKDIWEDLQDAVAGVENSGSDLTVKPINDIAKAVIELEENGREVSITIDTEMSDTSENAVQNKVIKAYVDNTKVELQIYLDEQILGGAW
jgi:F0F1-type ATP synthase delta subunit